MEKINAVLPNARMIQNNEIEKKITLLIFAGKLKKLINKLELFFCGSGVIIFTIPLLFPMMKKVHTTSDLIRFQIAIIFHLRQDFYRL